MDIAFDTYKAGRLHIAASLMTAAKAFMLSKWGVQAIRQDRGGTEPTDVYTFFYGKGLRIMNCVQDLIQAGGETLVSEVHKSIHSIL
jgi:hypothetical protein